MVRSARSRSRKRRSFTSAVFIITAVILVLVLRLVEDIGIEQEPGGRFVIARIIDGDTVDLAGGDRLRLLAIDTPERGEPLYNKASEFLEKLALGKKARIEYADKRRDRYGRLLGFLYVDDTIFANKRILESGLAYLYLVKDQDLNSPVVKQLLLAQRVAVEEKVGLWGLPQNYEDYYVTGKTSLRFHRPGCRSIAKSKPAGLRIFETKEEALYEGLSPCRICHP